MPCLPLYTLVDSCFAAPQEVKNIVWIATCLEHGVYTELDRIIPIFSRVKRAA
jgi:vacuolar-type H+-ATPase subunit C/Vma6